MWNALGGSREPFGVPRDSGAPQGSTREAGKDQLDSLGRHQGGRKGLIGQPARPQEAPGRQERTNWTARQAPGRHQGGRKGLIGQLARHQGGRKELIVQPGRDQGGAREVGKDHLDSLGYNPAEGLSL